MSHRVASFQIFLTKSIGLLVACLWLPSVMATEPQWDTLSPPPGADLECARLFEDGQNNSFTRQWNQTEEFLRRGRHYETVGNRMVRLETPRPYLKVLFPSMTLSYSVIGNIKNIEAYELRGFCPEVMKAAKDPTAHLVIVTSVELEEATVRNCIRISMKSKVPADKLETTVDTILKTRIRFVHADNASPLPLSQKFLQNPEKMTELRAMVDQIKQSNGIPDEGAYMQTFVTTPQEGWVADQLGVSVWGNPLLNAGIESKSTYHKVAETAGVKKADAEIDIHSEDQLVLSIYKLLERNLKRLFATFSEEGAQFNLPILQRIYDNLEEDDRLEMVRKLMQKWDQGTSGQGNAPKQISEAAVREYFAGNKQRALDVIRENLTQNMKTADEEVITPKQFVDKLVSDGGVVEQFVPYVQTYTNAMGQTFPVSPSGQADIRNQGIKLMGCHEQKFIPDLPGGVFLGAIYGWNRLGEDICRQVYRKTLQIGRVLKEMGYLGRFAVDFVVARNPKSGKLEVVVIEINARSGGTHTVDAMAELTSAYQYDEDVAGENKQPYHWYTQVMRPDGTYKEVRLYNEGTDNFYHQALKLFCSDQELLDFLYQQDDRYWKAGQKIPMADSVNRRGILPHMIQGRKGSPEADGKMGFVAIGHDSYLDANLLYSEFKASLTHALDEYASQSFPGPMGCQDH